MQTRQSSHHFGYLPAVDGLRALAVCAVILFHLRPAALPGGFTGVDIFFVISGFVVTGSMAGYRFDSLGELARHFYARRLVRIMPALVAMLLVTIAASQLFIPNAWLSDSAAQVARFAFAGLSNIVLATDTDSYFGPQAAYNPFTHSWSLGVEEQFYLLFPFLLWWHQRLSGGAHAVRVIVGLSAASLALAAALTFLAPKFAFYLIVTRFWELGAGMLLLLTASRWGPWLAQARPGIQSALGWGSLALVAVGLAIPEGALFPFPLALLPVLGTTGLIASLSATQTPLTRLFASAPMVAVGLLSYSLYLWHWPVFVLFRWTLGLDTPRLALAALGIVVVLALASYWLIERPIRRARWIAQARRGRVVAGMIAAVVLAGLGGQALIASHDRISLSVTRNAADWYSEGKRPLNPAISHCTVHSEESRMAGGKRRILTPQNCTRAGAGFTLFMPGDSHALAYAAAMDQLVAELGVPVRVYFRAGCPYLKLIETMASRPKCTPFYAAVVADINAAGKAGDVVFLPGLRLTRLTNQFEGDRDIEGPHDDSVSPEALAEAQRVLAQLSGDGRRSLVLEAPKPLFRSPTFRCSDWFNRNNPICRGGNTVPRDELLLLRSPVVAAMNALAVHQPGLTLWDPFPVLCPGDPCQALPDGRPLFFDGDHLSGFGNDRVYPSLRDTMLALTAPSPAAPAPPPAPAAP
ncbi:acyltransferase family protein [Sphingomonas sp. CJ20]